MQFDRIKQLQRQRQLLKNKHSRLRARRQNTRDIEADIQDIELEILTLQSNSPQCLYTENTDYLPTIYIKEKSDKALYEKLSVLGYNRNQLTANEVYRKQIMQIERHMEKIRLELSLRKRRTQKRKQPFEKQRLTHYSKAL